jgi:arylsulfatase A-like enzyme/Flp pilus assembly protein TadD
MKLAGILAAASLLVASCSRPPEPPASANLLLVSVDTLRADHLSCYGGDTPTPGFDRFAREGVLFENAVSVAPTTLPAHTSLLTGVFPIEHRVHDNVGFRLGDDLPTLASTLSAAGYRTGGFVGAFVLNRKFGLARGFDVYSDETPETDRGLRERRGDEVLGEAMAWIGSDRSRPFFAFVHFFDPHRPYNPPPPHAGDYRGEVAYVDSLLLRLHDFLDRTGLRDSTIVAVTADHGESLGEHGEDTHGFFVYQSTLHVPLLVRAPGIRPGQRASALVRTIDVAPTLLDLLRVPRPASFRGSSFVSTAGQVEAPQVEAYSETFVPRLQYGWSELRALRQGNWKLILAPRSELYDLGSDPGETRNLFDDESDVAADHSTRLEEMTRGQSVLPGSLDRETRGSLQALGYLGGGGDAAPPERSFRDLADPKDKLPLYRELNELTAIVKPDENDLQRLSLLLEKEPRSVKALSMLGNFSLDLGRSPEAKDAFERLLRIQPESYDGHYGLGRALAALGETERARKNLEKALDLDPRSSEVYYRLSRLENSASNLEASERWLRRGIEIAPSFLLYQSLAELLVSAGRGEELSRSAAQWKGPGAEAGAAYARGQIFASQENGEGALAELERAFSLTPRDDNVEQALANELSRAGRYEEAIRHYRAILDRSPCYLGALTNLGAAYERLGTVDDGLRAYERAIECDPKYGNAYRNLGAALARNGELSRALAILRRARSLSPPDAELDAAITELEKLTR